MTDAVIQAYTFIHRGRTIYIHTYSPDQANVVFQERFGYWPTKENYENVNT